MSDAVQIEALRAIPATITGIAAIVGAVLAYLGLRQGQRTHSDINGRMDQMLQLKGDSSKAVGIQEERKRNETK